MADAPETPAEKPASYYLTLIESAQNSPEFKEWDDRCKKIRKKYRYTKSNTVKHRQYQMLWSNMEVMKPAVMAKPPVPVVQRRYNDKDPVGRVAGEILERAERFQVEANDWYSRFEQVRDDYLLYARGQARLVYEPVFDTVIDEDDADNLDEVAMRGPQAEIAEEQEEAAEAGNPGEVLDFENVRLQFVQRGDFVHDPQRTWDEVGWVAFRAYLTKEELEGRFDKDKVADVQLDASPEQPDGERMNSNSVPTIMQKATVWEFWDKSNQKVLWITKDRILEASAPYLKLEGFFPCPKPAFGTLTTDSLAPIPDYVYYQDQAEEIDTLTARIGALQQALKLVGFYPAGPQGEGAPEVERAMAPGFENKLIAVKSWAIFQNGNGKGEAPIVWLPIEEVATLLRECVELRKQLIEDVYQIVGISDIMRGDAQASETATAQSIKAQYGGNRIRERQQELARFARDCIRMMAEIICTQFSPETLMKMTNMQLPTQQEVEMQQAQAALAAQQQQMQQAQLPAPQPQMPMAAE